MSIFSKNVKSLFLNSSFSQSAERKIESSGEWYKNKPGQNVIRMLPIRENGEPSFIQTVNHFFLKMKNDNNAVVPVSPVCLDYLFNENVSEEDKAYIDVLLEYAFKAKKLTEKDYENWENGGGCPICRCYRAFSKIDKIRSLEIRAKQRVYMLLKDKLHVDGKLSNKIYLYSMSLTMWQEFEKQTLSLEREDDIFVNDPDNGRDFRFEYVQNGRDSEYKGMLFGQKVSSFGDIEGEIPNLVKVWLSGVRDYNVLTDIVKTTPILAKIALENGLEF